MTLGVLPAILKDTRLDRNRGGIRPSKTTTVIPRTFSNEARSMKKYMLVVLAVMATLGCGDAIPSQAGCDVPSVDGSAPQDVQMVEATVPTSHHLTIRFLAPSDQAGVHEVNMVWVYPDGLDMSRPFMPRFLSRAAGEYEAIEMEVDTPSNEHVMNITWSNRLPSGDVIFGHWFIIQDDGTYYFAGEATVTDEQGRRWRGYPTIIKRGRWGFLRFVPGENCQRGYRERRDGICVR